MARTEPRVAILGCGPAGLLAAHACALAGVRYSILSPPKKSVLGGAQFLHAAIPGLTSPVPDAIVNYHVTGDAQTYQAKAYGPMGVQPSFVSFDSVYHGKTQGAWNLINVYDVLWHLVDAMDGIDPTTVTPDGLANLRQDFDLVVSSAPLPSLCRASAAMSQDAGQMTAGHVFHKQTIKIARNLCALPESWHGDRAEMTIFYNGDPGQAWYRSSSLWGHMFTEYGSVYSPPYEDIVTAHKPLTHTCDCHGAAAPLSDDNMLLVGRFGRWQKGVLTHQAFYETLAKLDHLGIARAVDVLGTAPPGIDPSTGLEGEQS